MSYAKQLLQERLDKLNNSYNQFVTLGEVLPTSPAAIENRQHAADIEIALTKLTIKIPREVKKLPDFVSYPEAALAFDLYRLDQEIGIRYLSGVIKAKPTFSGDELGVAKKLLESWGN